jgi:hypothetical protein
MKRFLITALLLSTAAFAQLRAPEKSVAGKELRLGTAGSSGDVFLFAPGSALKQNVKSGEEVVIPADKVTASGRYSVVMKGGETVSFFVAPSEAEKINFLARPSRVPVARPDVISGVAFVFDRNNNLVTQPAPVEFSLGVQGTAGFKKTVNSSNGIAWVKTGSAQREGAAQFVASANGKQTRRVVQQVAGDPCNLHMSASRQGDNLIVETSPIKDCSGNSVPDGTIVTFIQTSQGFRSTVDARIKRGIARATLPARPGMITVASGVVLGNEIRYGGE